MERPWWYQGCSSKSTSRKSNNAREATSVLERPRESNSKGRCGRYVGSPSDENAICAVAAPESYAVVGFESRSSYRIPSSAETGRCSGILHLPNIAEQNQSESIYGEETGMLKQIWAEQKFKIEQQHPVA